LEQQQVTMLAALKTQCSPEGSGLVAPRSLPSSGVPRSRTATPGAENRPPDHHHDVERAVACDVRGDPGLDARMSACSVSPERDDLDGGRGLNGRGWRAGCRPEPCRRARRPAGAAYVSNRLCSDRRRADDPKIVLRREARRDPHDRAEAPRRRAPEASSSAEPLLQGR
jgi:hypothetical protein